ncbi:hypothetical protein OM076_42700 [Solirubrobacter ginsenosidimutans]|uniref:Uncharacterized protein n=1 Tax=Solirubrobacter ginsenosidimutans TaxID=490573 RepID=A0A9X3N8Y9_9ACTN|nr:hypothetical protein [Solirubrobacter ginsenosidimutans]
MTATTASATGRLRACGAGTQWRVRGRPDTAAPPIPSVPARRRTFTLMQLLE